MFQLRNQKKDWWQNCPSPKTWQVPIWKKKFFNKKAGNSTKICGIHGKTFTAYPDLYRFISQKKYLPKSKKSLQLNLLIPPGGIPPVIPVPIFKIFLPALTPLLQRFKSFSFFSIPMVKLIELVDPSWTTGFKHFGH